MTSHTEEWDLVVVGFGAAGAAAAITASERGARVAILEKAPEDRHTSNTHMSGGLIMTVNDADAATEYLMHCAAGMVQRPLLRTLAERALGLKAWLERLEPDFGLARVNGAEHEFPGAHGIDAYQPGNPRFRIDPRVKSGILVHEMLTKAVKQRPIDVFYQSAAQRLLRDANGRIVGVVVRKDGAEQTFRATRGVVLASGGFEYDEDAKRNYLPSYPAYFYGNPLNTGDGVRMAQEVGADLWHMNVMVGRAVNYHKLPDGGGMSFYTNISPAGYVITDRYGKRFANEDAQAKGMHSFYFELLKFDPVHGVYPRNPCYWIFDETRRNAGPLVLTNVGVVGIGLYDWSTDNSRELEQGWFHQGRTVAEAASAAGIEDPEAAAHTLDAYNHACLEKQPDPFGRAAETMIPIVKPPFYCMKLFPGGPNTTGGPRRDERARIINALGQPIPGLFGAGELGQVSGLIYAADGFNLCEAMCFGQIAAESALSNEF